MNRYYKFLLNLLVKILYFFKIKKLLVTKIKFDLGLNNILLIQGMNYDNITDIHKTECKVFSQNGEDGIINYLISKLGISRPNFVEIGVGNYTEANTRFLYDRFYPKGIIIDCEKDLEKKVSSNVNLWRGDLKIIEKNINSENINKIISENCNFDIDLFSIDIDGIDYWVIESLNLLNTKIFIAEYNSVFGPDIKVSVPNDLSFSRGKYHYSHLCYGMSFMALIKIMKKKNFYFIGSNNARNNAFFVSNKFDQKKYFPNIIIQENSFYTESNIRESRTQSNQLSYISGKNRIKKIKDCDVIDLNANNKKKKLHELF